MHPCRLFVTGHSLLIVARKTSINKLVLMVFICRSLYVAAYSLFDEFQLLFLRFNFCFCLFFFRVLHVESNTRIASICDRWVSCILNCIKENHFTLLTVVLLASCFWDFLFIEFFCLHLKFYYHDSRDGILFGFLNNEC